jgi:hypothetical protein
MRLLGCLVVVGLIAGIVFAALSVPWWAAAAGGVLLGVAVAELVVRRG